MRHSTVFSCGRHQWHECLSSLTFLFPVLRRSPIWINLELLPNELVVTILGNFHKEMMRKGTEPSVFALLARRKVRIVDWIQTILTKNIVPKTTSICTQMVDGRMQIHARLPTQGGEYSMYWTKVIKRDWKPSWESWKRVQQEETNRTMTHSSADSS